MENMDHFVNTVVVHGFIIGYNVGSYTQGRIAGDFLSSRKAARAERCPPKTTDAELAG
jgi:hypothetical protein